MEGRPPAAAGRDGRSVRFGARRGGCSELMPESKPMPESNEEPYSPGIDAIFEVVARLRAPDGCPWDREQTHESLRPYLLEETYELLEAIDSKDDTKIKEELGDLLLQLAIHPDIAPRQGP